MGAGYVSAYHIKALQTLPHVAIVGLADTATDRARELAGRFGISNVFDSLAAMKPERPDVIHILTPPDSHCALTLQALDMGCHVFVEKPMAPSVHECDAMIAAAQRSGRVLSVNHSAKDDPVIVQGLALVKAGAIGDVLAASFIRGSDYPPYAGGPMPSTFHLGGYPFEDIGIHGLYLLEAFLGPIADLDTRYRSTGRHPNVHFDDWHCTVECERGVGQMFLSWTARPMRNELCVYGTRGYLHIDCFLQTCAVHKVLPGPKAIGASVDAVTHAARNLYRVPRNMVSFVTGRLRPSPGIHAGVIRFHEALRTHQDPPVSAEDGRRMIAWIEGPCRKADKARRVALRLDAPVPGARVLVTGAAGFLGRALLNRLVSRGESVRVLIRRRSQEIESLPGVHVVYGDLGDPQAIDRAVAGVNVVYHVGATMRGRGWPDFESGTVWGTRNIIESCLRHSVHRLVYVSSLSVLDHASHNARTRLDEGAPTEPFPELRGAYTKSKLQAERAVVEAIRDRHLRAVILRLGQVCGPGAESVPPSGTIAIAGRWIVIGSGKALLPLVHVDDVVDAMLSAATKDGVVSMTLHLVDRTPVTQDEYIAAVSRMAPASPRVVHVPRWLLYSAGLGLEVVGKLLKRSVPLSRYRVDSIKELAFHSSAAQIHLGWFPATPLPGADTIARRNDTTASGRAGG